ncbi:MAG: alpha/beta hydrolase [Pseudonocardiales bacterium]|nr:MAG: alpha/beta hydrolase [Pseudonocardiales bacterium]
MDSQTFDACRKTVQTPSGRIGYAETGDGPVALFVHGVIVNAYLWRHQLAALADMRRCIAVDLLGHGDSSTMHADQDLSFNAQAAMLAQFLGALGIDTVDLVGNDSGTGIAQVFAVAHTDRVRSLTLTNGDVHDNWTPAAFTGFTDMVAAGGLADTIRGMAADKAIFRNSLGASYEHADQVADETIDAYLQPYLHHSERLQDLERFVLAFDNAQTTGIEGQLKTLDVPTLVAWGTGDIFFDTTWSHWLADTIPGVRGRVELDNGHLLFPEERYDEFNQHLRNHFQSTM